MFMMNVGLSPPHSPAALVPPPLNPHSGKLSRLPCAIAKRGRGVETRSQLTCRRRPAGSSSRTSGRRDADRLGRGALVVDVHTDVVDPLVAGYAFITFEPGFGPLPKFNRIELKSIWMLGATLRIASTAARNAALELLVVDRRRQPRTGDVVLRGEAHDRVPVAGGDEPRARSCGRSHGSVPPRSGGYCGPLCC